MMGYLLWLSGCATIISGRQQQVTMNNSGGATYFTVIDNKNRVVHSGVTPAQVTLKSSAAPFRPAKYRVVYAGQDGPQQYNVDTHINWWTAGNIVIGGVPGIVIDAASGALWKLDSDVTGHVPGDRVVADASEGAAVVAAYTDEESSVGPSNSNVRQASFGNQKSKEQ